MPQRQERPRPRHSSKDEQHYIILIQDIPRHCRWQELKDMTRSLGGEQSLKAEVFSAGDGTQLGHCTIKGKADAVKVYENLCKQGWNGQRVRVKLVAQEKDGSLRKIQGPKESNGIITSERPTGLYLPNLQGPATTTRPSANPLYTVSAHQLASVSYPTPYTTMATWAAQPAVPSLASTMAPATTAYPSGVCPPRPSYLPHSTHPSTMAPPVSYSTRFNGDSARPPSPPSAPPLVRRGNDGSKIFISGLPYYQSESELRDLLRRYGNVFYLEIHPDSRNPGKNKGTARARYKTPTEALSAVRDLDGRYLSNRKISVKQEKDEPILTAAAGSSSSGSGSSRRRWQETQGGSGSSTQKKSGVSSKTTSSKTKRHTAVPSKETAREPFRAARKRSGHSSGSTSPTGPLVVNGARCSSARRGSWDEKSADDSDDSSDDSEGSEEGVALVAEEEDEGEEEDEDDDDVDDDDEVGPKVRPYVTFL
ncbi:hypothetical protein Z517_02432 [Fonsecaea pedrosoi CBS 271.37]|uniref:RRM domain-containing protein n=1 Tax=Fonsecaea pedrosoi CBS 271.37 TaxID=1442368 RepID=A0A0D2F967_9EURO|nr:uncharacterized protein Z517_02432 [Fonsecaea pedrosoi CBS 271.37]KIW83187.1 hypothetical protein Z517_02432 [Fonsecaea pedrosoi CBS 271.37]